MIGLKHKYNMWGDVFDYNDNFLLAANVVLMLYYIYVIVIYDSV